MKKLILTTIAMLALNANAESAIYTDQFVRLNPGTAEMTLTISMTTDRPCDRWMFDLVLPDGIKPISVTPLDGMALTYAGDTLQAPLCVSQDMATITSFVGINQHWDASTNTIENGVFKWEAGKHELMEITFAVAPDFRFSVMFLNGIIDNGSTDVRFFSPTNISVGYNRGDVNGDGHVSIADVSAIIDHLLGGELDEYQREAADANTDGKLSIADVSTLIDMI
jgi:hypothetical protein